MAPDRNDTGGRQRKTAGAHRQSRKRRRVLTRTVAAGGAAICLGAAYDLSSPSADALSILLPGATVNGVGNTTRINILEGNIFNPQLGISGGTSSNNTTVGNVVMNQGNNIFNQLLSQEIRLGGAAGHGNTTQINILSYNIFNPQFSLIGRNISNNTSINNVSANNGNNSTTDVSNPGGMLPWLGGAAGNGNTTQFSFFSGNIFNPQWSMLGGGNVSNNTTFTNVAIGNGNYSLATLSMGGWFGSFLMGGGNGNTTQYGFFVSNIYNPQFTFGGGNISNNTAATNTSAGNGNNSGNAVTGGGLGVGGTTGNGNTNQTSIGSGNINNDQVNVGPGSATTVSTTTTNPVVQQLGLDSIVAAAGTGPSAAGTDDTTSTNLQSQQLQRESFSANVSNDSTGSATTTTGSSNDTPSGLQAGDAGAGDPEGGDTSGSGDGDGGGDDSGGSGV